MGKILLALESFADGSNILKVVRLRALGRVSGVMQAGHQTGPEACVCPTVGSVWFTVTGIS